MIALAQYHVEMTQLCSNSETFLGAFAMICLILGILLHIANYFWNSGKPKTSKKPLLWLAGIWIFVIGVLCLIIYVILPPIITILAHDGNALGADGGYDPCSQYDDPYSKLTPSPPYCGDYCYNKSVPKDYQNCTCT